MTHKPILIILLGLFTAFLPAIAQTNNKFDIKKFKDERAKFIISEVGLTESEARTFIPLSNELMDKRFDTNKPIRQNARNLKNKKDKSDLDYHQLIEASFDARAKELQLDKEYYQKFKKILSSEKIYKYQKAESRFMRNMFTGERARKKSDKK